MTHRMMTSTYRKYANFRVGDALVPWMSELVHAALGNWGDGCEHCVVQKKGEEEGHSNK